MDEDKMKQSCRYYRLAILCIAAVILSSCTETIVSQPEPGLPPSSNIPIKPTRAVDTSYGPLTRIIASDQLIGYIALVNPRIGQTGAFTKAQVTVQNLTQNRYSMEYQFQWEDAQQFAVGSPRPWVRFVLGPQEAKNIQEMALNKESIRTKFTIRLPDDTFIELNRQMEKSLKQ
jgi:uncharacterized protein YcfL